MHVDSWRTTYYSGIVPKEFLAGLSYEAFEERWRGWIGDRSGTHGYFYVAEVPPHGIVGFAAGGRRRGIEYTDYEGELYAIYLLRGRQRRGAGRSLFDTVVRRLLKAGIGSMLVWVLDRNPSRRFYEVLGGELLGSRQIEIGGAILEEVAYGWSDLWAQTSEKPE